MYKEYKLNHISQKILLVGAGAVLLAAMAVIGLKFSKAHAACAGSQYGSGSRNINVASSGTHRVWVRVMPATSTNNSFYLQVDSGSCVDVGTTGTVSANQWTWVDYKNGNQSTKNDVSLTAGNHTLSVYGKAADLKIDRIILTTNTSCVPSDKGDNCATVATPPPSGGGSSSAEAMKGVWAIKQFSQQTGGGGTFDSNTMNADIAGFSARMPWKLVQTGQTNFNWTAFDALVNSAKAKGKKVRLSVMAGVNAPPQGSWVSYQYPWFVGSDDSQCDSAKANMPVPWDSGLLSAQTTLINEMARKWKTDWGTTVAALQVTGPSARWEELCLPNNTVSQPGYSYNSRTDNIIRKTWSDTMDKWNTALNAQGIGSNRMFISVSAPPPFYPGLSDDVGNDAVAKFGSRVSLQWHFLDTGFASSVSSVSSTWKSKAMVAWQEWGATAFKDRLMGAGKGAACGTGTVADCDITTASNQDVTALNASLNLAKDSGASYMEVYDEDLKFPLLSAAAATIHNQMKGGTTVNNDTTPPDVSLSASPATVTAGSPVNLVAAASDNFGVTKVEFYEGSKLLGSDQTSPYGMNWTTTGVSAGTHNLTAKAYDAAGNSRTSSEVPVDVQTSTPTTTVGTPNNLSVIARNFVTTLGFNLQWDKVNNASGYKLYRNSTLVPNAIIATNAQGKITATDSAGVRGFTGYNYTVTAVGDNGRESSQSKSTYGRCDWFIWWFCK